MWWALCRNYEKIHAPEDSLWVNVIARAKSSCALNKSQQEITIIQYEIRAIFCWSKREIDESLKTRDSARIWLSSNKFWRWNVREEGGISGRKRQKQSKDVFPVGGGVQLSTVKQKSPTRLTTVLTNTWHPHMLHIPAKCYRKLFQILIVIFNNLQFTNYKRVTELNKSKTVAQWWAKEFLSQYAHSQVTQISTKHGLQNGSQPRGVG